MYTESPRSQRVFSGRSQWHCPSKGIANMYWLVYLNEALLQDCKNYLHMLTCSLFCIHYKKNIYFHMCSEIIPISDNT